MPAADDLGLFHDALKATLIANGVLGKVRAELKVAALEAVRRQPPHDDDMDVPAAVGAHEFDAADDATALAHALVLDFLASPTLSRSASVFESEAGAERLPAALRAREGLERAAGVAGSSPNEPLLVSLLRRPGGIAGSGASPAASPMRVPLKRQSRVVDPQPAGTDSESADEEEHESPTASAASSPAKFDTAAAAGPSFSVAKAARWPAAGTRTGGISREPSVEFSDATAAESVEEGVDWDYVEKNGDGNGASPVTVAAPAATTTKAAQPATTSHADPLASGSSHASSSPNAHLTVPGPRNSMNAPEDTDSDADEDEQLEAARRTPVAPAPLATAAPVPGGGENYSDDDMYGFDDDDDEF